MATRKSSFDWNRIELEYLAGEASVREIADRHEISEGAIRKRAKAEEWVRSARTVRTVRTVRTEPVAVTASPVEPVPVPDAAVIAERGRGLVARMLDELDATTTHQGKLEEMIEDETSGDREARRRDGMLAAISLTGRAKTLKELATAFKTINEASAPQGKKAGQQEKADQIANRFRGVGPPTLKSVK